MACSDCKFFDKEYSECRAHPPTVTTSIPDGKWPEVDPDDWCGEWQPKNSPFNSFGNKVEGR